MKAYKLIVQDIFGNEYPEVVYAGNKKEAENIARHNPLNASVIAINRTSENQRP
jgi:hypothetical protein